MEEVNEEKTLCSENTKEYSICIISYIYGNIYNFNTSINLSIRKKCNKTKFKLL